MWKQIVIFPECRQVIQSQQGTISSPDDPEFDSAYPSCSYIISETQGYYISLVFSSIDLARETQCGNYIKVSGCLILTFIVHNL